MAGTSSGRIDLGQVVGTINGVAAPNVVVNDPHLNVSSSEGNLVLETVDVESPSGAQEKATAALNSAKEYADQKITDLVGAAPENMDTLKELGDLVKQNQDSISEIVAGAVGEMIIDNAMSTTSENPVQNKVVDAAIKASQSAAQSYTDTQVASSLQTAKNYADAQIADAIENGGIGSPTLSSISITTQPTKLSYSVGESFDPTGMVVTAEYSNGSSQEVSGYTYTPNGALTISDDTITVSYVDNGVEKTATVAISVGKIGLAVPTVDGELTFNGTSQSPTLNGYDASKMELSGDTSATAAGNYSVIVTIKDTTNYQFVGGGTQKTLSWVIKNAPLTKPSLSTNPTYNGSAQSPVLTGYDANTMAQSGDTSATDAGNYSMQITPKTNYQWSDGTTTAVTINWTIERSTIADDPTITESLTYNTSSQSPTVNNYDAAKMSKSGDVTKTDAGTYTMTITPGANYCWSDGTTAAKNLSWTIDRGTIAALPTQSGSLTYNGSALTPTWSGYDAAKLTLNETAQSAAGSYQSTFTPTSNWKWWDGTTTAKTANWSIGKASCTATTDAAGNALAVDVNGTGEINVTRPGDGVVSAVSSNTSIATVSVVGTKVTVTPVAKGSCNVTISVAEGTNHNAASNVVIAVTVAKVPTGKVYGFQFKNTESAPASKIAYLGECENGSYTAAAMSGASFNYGSWADVWFIRDLVVAMLNFDGTVAYEINKNDYTKKLDGTAVGTEGNVMVGFPTVWIKVDTTDSNNPKFYFSDTQVDSNYHAYAHTDSAGNIMEYTWMPAYVGVNQSSKLRSLTGKTPSGNISATNNMTYARANNVNSATIWDMETYADWQLVNLLLMLITKTTDCQTAVGRGYVDGNSAALATGTMDTKGLFWGETTGKYGCKVFGMENWWGSQYRWKVGLLNNKGHIYVKLTRGTADGSTVNDYSLTSSSGYLDTGISVSSDKYGYIKGMKASTWGLLPDGAATGSETTYVPDYYYYYTSDVYVASCGGAWGHGSAAGAWYVVLNYAASDAGTYIGAALSCKPLAA